MSKSAEMTRKDMKEPDKFQEVAGEAASWLTGHRRQTLLLFGGIGVAALVALAVLGWRESRAARSGEMLAAVYAVADGQVSAVPLPGLPGPFYPTEAARQRAIADAASRLLAEYPGTPAAALGALAKGDASLRLGELDAAAAAYRTYLDGAPRGDALRFGALEGLALVDEAKGNLDGALAGFTRLATEVPAQADRADLEKARLLVKAGKAAEAKALLAGFAEAHKASPLASEAADRLTKLGGK